MVPMATYLVTKVRKRCRFRHRLHSTCFEEPLSSRKTMDIVLPAVADVAGIPFPAFSVDFDFEICYEPTTRAAGCAKFVVQAFVSPSVC